MSLAIALLLSSQAIAAGQGFQVTSINGNTWIEKDTHPGNILEEIITINNLEDTTSEYSIKFAESEGPKENIHIKEDQPFNNIGQWTRLESEKISVEAKSKKAFMVRIKVPEGTALQKYQGVILVAPVKQGKDMINIVTRTGVRIYLNVTNQPTPAETSLLKPDSTPLAIILIGGATLALLYSYRKEKQN